MEHKLTARIETTATLGAAFHAGFTLSPSVLVSPSRL